MLKKFLTSGVLHIGGSLLIFLMQVVMARFSKTSSDYGVFIFFFSTLLLLSILPLLGFQSSIIKFISTARAKEVGSLRLVKKVSFVILTSSITVAVGIVVYYKFIGMLTLSIFFMAISIIPYCFMRFYTQVFLANKDMFWALFPSRILYPFVVIIITIYLGQNGLSAESMLLNLLISLSLIAVFQILLYKIKNTQVGGDCNLNVKIGRLFRVSLPMLITSAFATLMGQCDIIMLGILTSPETTAHYFAAVKVAAFILIPLIIVNQFAPTEYSRAFEMKKIKKMRILAIKYAKISFLLTFPILLVVIIFGEKILNLFGNKYSSAYLPLCILGCAQALNAFSGSVSWLLNLTGNEKLCTIIFSSSVILNLLLNFLFIPIWGDYGAAIASGVSMAFWNFSALFTVKRRVAIDPSIFGVILRSLSKSKGIINNER